MRLGHQPALDGLRAIAIVLVVLEHTGDLLIADDPPGFSGGPFMPGGFLGVDLFFVLSGFLITTLLLEERADRGRVGLLAFYERRALRLLPALGVLLVSTTVWVAAAGDGLRNHLRGVAGAAAYVSNWLLSASVDTGDFGLGHLWSLAVEEQFYLAWPILLTVVLFVARTPRSVVAACVVTAVLAAVQRSMVADSAGVLDAYVRTDTRADGLLIGGALAVARSLCGFAPRWSRHLVLPGLCVIVTLAATTAFTDAWLYDGGFFVVAVVSGTVVCGAITGTSRTTRVLASRPLQRVGSYSYTAYLLHFPVFQAVGDRLSDAGPWARIGFAWAISLVAITACHRWVEQPFLDLKERRSDARSRSRSRHAQLERELVPEQGGPARDADPIDRTGRP